MPRFCLLPAAVALAAAPLFPVPLHAGDQARVVRFVDGLLEGRRQKIVVYGTSLTANSQWPELLRERLHDDFGSKAKIINAALGGMDSRWGLSNIRKRVTSESPDAVFIEFAVNDAVEHSKLSTAESRWDLEQMISIVRQDRPECQVILMVMNPPTGDALKDRPNYRRYEQVYRDVAAKYRCPIIDFSSSWKRIIARQPERWRDYAPDGLHPNGQAAAEVILPQMLKQLGLSRQAPGDLPGTAAATRS